MSLRIGTNSFLARCGGISTTLMRRLEKLKVIRPQKTDCGWRVFTPADVRAAKVWIARRDQRRAAR